MTSLSRNTTNKAYQVNFVEMNIKTCYRSGCQALQSKKMTEEMKLFREQINQKNYIINS